jgi:hypothetical protein
VEPYIALRILERGTVPAIGQNDLCAAIPICVNDHDISGRDLVVFQGGGLCQPGNGQTVLVIKQEKELICGHAPPVPHERHHDQEVTAPVFVEVCRPDTDGIDRQA